jgi:hypothetical protein
MFIERLPYLSEQHVKRPREPCYYSVLQFATRRPVLDWRDATLLRSIFEYYRLICLFHRQGEQEGCQGDEDHTPLAPLPGFVLSSKPADNRTTSVSA